MSQSEQVREFLPRSGAAPSDKQVQKMRGGNANIYGEGGNGKKIRRH